MASKARELRQKMFCFLNRKAPHIILCSCLAWFLYCMDGDDKMLTHLTDIMNMRSIARKAPVLSISENGRELWANPEGNLLERIQSYQEYLSRIRKHIIDKMEEESPNSDPFYHPDKMVSVFGFRDDYLAQVSSRPEIKTLYLKWAGYNMNKMWDSREDSANVLIQNYHRWTASEPLCTWFKNDTTRGNFHIVHNYTCDTAVEHTRPRKKLDIYVLHGKPVLKYLKPLRFYPSSKSLAPWKFTQTPEFVTYVHMIKDVVVDRYGRVYSNTLYLVQDTCSIVDDIQPRSDVRRGAPLYDEVMVLYQHYSDSYYHKLLESAPRMVPYLQFLQKHDDIKIYFPPLDRVSYNLLDIFNISDDRIIYIKQLETFSAKLVYLPRSTPCGNPLVQESQLLSKIFKDYTVNNLEPGRRNRLIIIQRSWDRRFLHHIAIAEMLQDVATDYGLEYSVWLDHPAPSFLSGMKMFYEAVMVVAPHGGGGSNLLFSQPGTYVVEAVPTAECLNIWAMCFQRASYILGHHYHGLPSKDGCEEYLDVSMEDVKEVVIKLLNIWKSEKGNNEA